MNKKRHNSALSHYSFWLLSTRSVFLFLFSRDWLILSAKLNMHVAEKISVHWMRSVCINKKTTSLLSINSIIDISIAYMQIVLSGYCCFVYCSFDSIRFVLCLNKITYFFSPGIVIVPCVEHGLSAYNVSMYVEIYTQFIYLIPFVCEFSLFLVPMCSVCCFFCSLVAALFMHNIFLAAMDGG